MSQTHYPGKLFFLELHWKTKWLVWFLINLFIVKNRGLFI